MDPIIQIAVVESNILTPGVFKKTVLCLNTCDPIQNTTVVECTSEHQLLKQFETVVNTQNPDIVTGYNILNFDFPYIVNRAKTLGFQIKLGRDGEVCTATETKFSSNQAGSSTSYDIAISGRVVFDMLPVIKKDVSIKLRSYSLNSVSAEFLDGEQKDDVPYTIIPDLQNGSSETRKRLARYCVKDAVLPIKLIENRMSLYNYIEMARVTGVTINDLLKRGQSRKVESQLLSAAIRKSYIIPTYRPEKGIEREYTGATVINPIKAYHTDPVTTLDFASLYPSIMMAHNLCYTSLNIKSANAGTPAFAPKEKNEGLLPSILRELLDARKAAKRELKQERDPIKRAVLDGRQLALKVSANSVYGFTGATIGSLPCLQISATVTGYGREMIAHSKAMAEKEKGTTVIYGDTDSIMVKFANPPIENPVLDSINRGKSLAANITATFKSPIKLEFEKVCSHKNPPTHIYTLYPIFLSIHIPYSYPFYPFYPFYIPYSYTFYPFYPFYPFYIPYSYTFLWPTIGLLPLPPHRKKTIRRTILDFTRKTRQNGR